MHRHFSTTTRIMLAFAFVAAQVHRAPAQSTAPASVSVKTQGVVGDLRLEKFTSTVFANARYL
ncbi:MAG: hypothetical protein M3Y30_09940, partial [Gemmatimonadota bacterium]|nr:hypothetical protein [Gemmatimonadota bacterium]